MTRYSLFLIVTCSLPLTVNPSSINAQESLVELADEGQRLASLLRVGRSVVSSRQDLINDPSIGHKGLDSKTFLALVEAEYKTLYGVAPLEGGLTPEQERLTQVQLDAMAEVMDENQELINSEGIAFKGFIPAIFGRLVNELFVEELGGDAKVKVTAPDYLVRNRKARPDDWEKATLTKFGATDWPKGEAFYEELVTDGATIFRMLIPEYYGESCLTCHGGPKGEVDVTGFPKEGGAAGDLAGAISISLRK